MECDGLKGVTMTIKTKIIGASLAKALIVTVVGIVGAIGLVRAKIIFSRTSDVALPEVQDTGEIAQSILQIDMLMDSSLDAADKQDVKRLAANEAPIEAALLK